MITITVPPAFKKPSSASYLAKEIKRYGFFKVIVKIDHTGEIYTAHVWLTPVVQLVLVCTIMGEEDWFTFVEKGAK